MEENQQVVLKKFWFEFRFREWIVLFLAQLSLILSTSFARRNTSKLEGLLNLEICEFFFIEDVHSVILEDNEFE